MAKSQAKRSFGFNADNMLTARPVLDEGYYAGVVSGASVYSKDSKPQIDIVPEEVWDRDAINENSGKKGARVKTGNFIIKGRIIFMALLTSKKAIATLQRDEPKVGVGDISLNFTKADSVDHEGNPNPFTLDPKNNIALVNTAKALGLDLNEFISDVDFEYDENIEVPEELAAVPNIVDMLNSLQYQRSWANSFALAMNGLPGKFMVAQQQKRNSPTEKENTLPCNFGNACVILPYTEGAEDDLG